MQMRVLNEDWSLCPIKATTQFYVHTWLVSAFILGRLKAKIETYVISMTQ